ncbi:MAG: hypothetical protein JXR36_11580 [Bacteroidales bacterium]|nr:hypothetical protein [Bacteroidales bacterium]
MSTNKLRVIQDFEKLSKEIQEQIKLSYPEGFSQHLIQFTNKEGRLVSALPFETDEKIYLVRMTTQEALDIILDDDDYNDDGMLKVASKEQFADKYAELDYMSDAVSDDDDDLSDDYDEPYDDDEDDDED